LSIIIAIRDCQLAMDYRRLSSIYRASDVKISMRWVLQKHWSYEEWNTEAMESGTLKLWRVEPWSCKDRSTETTKNETSKLWGVKYWNYKKWNIEATKSETMKYEEWNLEATKSGLHWSYEERITEAMKNG
jgi:hypothetical protein